VEGEEEPPSNHDGLGLPDAIQEEDDEYDPSSPQFIAPASLEEVESTNARMLAQQIAKLESYAARKRSSLNTEVASNDKVVHHYQSVLETMKHTASTSSSSGGARRAANLRCIQSAPDLQDLMLQAQRPRRGHAASEVEEHHELLQGIGEHQDGCSSMGCGSQSLSGTESLPFCVDSLPAVQAPRGSQLMIASGGLLGRQPASTMTHCAAAAGDARHAAPSEETVDTAASSRREPRKSTTEEEAEEDEDDEDDEWSGMPFL